MEVRSLIARIANSFPAEPIPAIKELLYKSDYSGDPELEEIRSFFGDRPWSSVTPSDVFQFRHALSFFSPSALAYFTPAWMTCALVDEDAVDTAIEDLVGNLGKADTKLWTQDQLFAICEWLHQMNHFDLPSLRNRFEKATENLGCGVKGSGC